jgi:nucleoside-diphosphate-sugar epimerase
VPAFVTSCLKGEPPVIFGDGGQTRDFTFVKDAVQANLLALEKDVPGGAVFNVASSRRTSINELAALAIRLTGRTKITPLHSDAREGDVRHSLADITTITKILGYKPRYSLEEGLTAVIDWMKSTSS